MAAPSLTGLIACNGRDDVLGAGPAPGYGPLEPAGRELALPPGFRFVSFGREGSAMSDGHSTPRAHDGMAAFDRGDGSVRLLRNHEDRSGPADARPVGEPSLAYDPSAGGAVTALDIERTSDGPRLVRDFVALSGTIVNCAGGPTPWGSWLSCEESTEGTQAGWTKDHGYVFEVSARAEFQVEARPIKAMGRFVHEAVAVDPRTGIVYETEDRPTAGFYRFLPRRPGDLQAGGQLEMLAIKGQPGFDTSSGLPRGATLPVEWVEISEPDPAGAESNPLHVFEQGYVEGAAVFARLEGCWFGDDSVYFHSTTGGDAESGQVWQYVPDRTSGGTLRLVFESPDPEVLDGPDNITVTPRGGIVICEDGGGTNYLRGMTQEGRIFDLARNILNDREFAGATFSSDGRILFVNIQGDLEPRGPGNPGLTFAIWGPWGRGVL